MRKLALPLLALQITIFSCQPKAAKDTDSDPTNVDREAAVSETPLAPALSDWVSAVREKATGAIQDSYAEGAVLAVSNDEIISGPEDIAAFYTSTDEQIISVESLFEVVANEPRGISYELVRLKTDSLAEYVVFTVWEQGAERKTKVFEFIEQSSSVAPVADQLEGRRQMWMTLCNGHDVPGLVTELYTPDALYFNHKPLVQGRDNLIKEYGYMGNTNYSLTLRPLHIEQVKADCAIEIGQCEGSYGGNYVLVWMKGDDGAWQIFLDSNV